MATKDILVTDYVHPILIDGLRGLGYSTTYAPEMSRTEMESLLHHYRGVIINTRCALGRDALLSAPSLRWIGRLGSGLDIIDLEAASEMNIRVLSAPEGNATAVAEHALGMLLALMNKLISADQSVREGSWLREQHRGRELSGKTIGIIGFGNNGSALGRLWHGWNVRVLAYDKYLTAYGNDSVQETDLATLQHESDIISLHIPLTRETYQMVNEEFISACKSGFILINTSRGNNLDLGAVVAGLRSGQIGGACLDVLPFEPPDKGPVSFADSFQQLCHMDQVVLSPHIAGWTVESKRKIAEVLLEKIKQCEW